MSVLFRTRQRGRMTFVAAVRRKIQQFGPYKSLAVLLVPLLFVEPIKMTGVAFVGFGHWAGGACMIVGAYAAGVLFVDRLYRVVKSKIYTISWCAWLAGILQARLARTRRMLQWSRANPERVERIKELEDKIAT